MDSPVSDVTPKDRAFRAIGRNLVSLQRLEKILKGLAALRPIACRLPEIATESKRRSRSTRRSTLGKVIHQWLETAQGEEPRTPDQTSDLDVFVSFWIKLPIPQDVLDKHAKELDQICTQRNWFVHTGLIEIDFDSDEACGNLIARLDKQERQITKQIEFFRTILNRIVELSQIMAQDDIQQTIAREMFRERTQSDT